MHAPGLIVHDSLKHIIPKKKKKVFLMLHENSTCSTSDAIIFSYNEFL